MSESHVARYPFARTPPKQFLRMELPETLRPTAQSRRLQIAVIWGGDQLIEVRDVKVGEPFTIGPKDASLQVFHHLPVHGAMPLVQVDRDGAELLVLPMGAAPTVWRDGVELSFEQLRGEGQAERIDIPVPGVRYALGLHERATLHLGDVQLLLRYTSARPMVPRAWHERLDHGFMAAVAAIGLISGLLVKMVVSVPSPKPIEVDAFVKRIRPVDVTMTPVKPPKPPKRAMIGAKAPGKPGTIGRPKAQLAQAAPNIPQHAKPAPLNMNNIGLLNALNNVQAQTAEVLAGGPAGKLDNALAGLTPGAVAGIGQGTNGFTARGSDSGAGGNTVGIGNVGDRPGSGAGGPRDGLGGVDRHKQPTKFAPGIVVADDPGYKDLVARIVRKHWNEIRYCYERELAHDPSLSGKVSMYFEIGPTGEVTVSSVRETTLGNDSAQDCMTRNVRTWAFPSPKSGLVQVTYPFLFEVAR
jgi:hypothetical protein